MTPEQIDLVRKSFDALWPFRRKLAEQFYGRFFELAPETRRLFPNDMEKQQLKLMSLVRSIGVKYVGPSSATQAGSTRSLGYRHRILLRLVTHSYGACNSSLVPRLLQRCSRHGLCSTTRSRCK